MCKQIFYDNLIHSYFIAFGVNLNYSYFIEILDAI